MANYDTKMPNHGDTLKITLNYRVAGQPIAEGFFDEIEFCLGEKRFTLTEGTVVWDNALEAYTIELTQADTFALNDADKYQLRVKKDTAVASSGQQTITFGPTISRTVL